ncbi:MAG: prepilin peptidase [Pseudomonadota bacterium]
MNIPVTITATQAWIFLPLALPICIWAIYSDVREFKIRNYAVLALIAGFVVLGPFALDWAEYFWRFAHFAVVFAIGYGLWAFTGLGAGDAKIAAAISLFVALPDVTSVLLIWLVAMIVMALLYSRRAVQVAQTDGVRAARKMEVPFGIALAPTLIAYLVLGIAQGGA